MSHRTSSIRVLVADDHPLYLRALADTVRASPDLVLVGEAADGRAALAAIRESKADVAVLDLEMPGLDGREVAEAVAASGLATRILVVSGQLGSDRIYATLAAGVGGMLFKSATPDELRDAVVRVARGETVLGRELHDAVAREIRRHHVAARVELTPRESEILERLAAGASTPLIAGELDLSQTTVKTYLQRLYEKLGVNDRAAAVAEGLRRGLID